MDKLRALQKRYGHSAGKQTGVSLTSSTESTSSLPSMSAITKPVGALPSTTAGSSAIQDLRLRLNSMRTGDISVASSAAPLSSDVPSSTATLDSAAAVQQLKARLARIKQTSASSS